MFFLRSVWTTSFNLRHILMLCDAPLASYPDIRCPLESLGDTTAHLIWMHKVDCHKALGLGDWGLNTVLLGGGDVCRTLHSNLTSTLLVFVCHCLMPEGI